MGGEGVLCSSQKWGSKKSAAVMFSSTVMHVQLWLGLGVSSSLDFSLVFNSLCS